MSISSSFDEYILAATADQLTTASRTAFCIASPMVKVPEQCIAIVASSGFRPSLVKVPRSTNLDAVVHLAANVDLSDTAALGLHHVFAANRANCAHQCTSSLLKKFFSAAIFVDVVVPEPAVVLHGGQVKARITIIPFVLNDDGLTFVVRTAAGQFITSHQFLEFPVSHGLHLFLYCRWLSAHDHIRS